MGVRRVCAALAVTATVAGCGSTAPAQSGRSQLERYLNRVVVEQRRYERTRGEAVSALRHASTVSPDRTWRDAAEQLRKVEREYDRLIGRMDAIAAPVALQKAHAGMIESLQLYERLVANLEGPLGKLDVVAMGRTLSMTTKLGIRANQLRTRWRVAARTRAERLGLSFPVALDHVGRQLLDQTPAA